MIEGVLIFVAGLLTGAGGVWFMARYHDNERLHLYQALGMQQARMAQLLHESGEATAQDLGLGE